MHSTMILVGSDVQEGVLVDETFPCKSIVDHFNLIISGCYRLNETLNRIMWWIFFVFTISRNASWKRTVCPALAGTQKKKSHVCFWFNSLIYYMNSTIQHR